MKQIPKHPNQKFGGMGTSIIALLVVLLALPFTTYFIISLTDISGTETSYQQFDNGLTQSHFHQPTFYEFLNSGNGHNTYCSEEDAHPASGSGRGSPAGTYGNDTMNGTWIPCATYFNLPQTYASELWNAGVPCADMSQLPLPAYTECGDDGYSFAFTDALYNFSNTGFAQMKFEWLSRGLTHACANETIGVPMTGYIKADYTISFQIWTYINYFPLNNVSGYTGYQVVEYHHELITGTMTNYNAFQDDVTGQCVPYWRILTDLSYTERTAISKIGWDDYYGYWGEQPIITFIVDIDNLYDVELEKPLSLSNKIMPFQTHPYNTSTLARFSFVTISQDFTGYATMGVMGGLGVVFWGLALASTPAWNPVVKWSQGRVKSQ